MVSVYIGGNVYLYDSCVNTALTKSLKLQRKQLYYRDGSLLIVQEIPVHQQENCDCGVFAIAFAFHLAQGDDPSALNFDCTTMRQHLVKCFEKKLSNY